MKDADEIRTELIISEILRWGVRASLALILLGSVLFFVQSGDWAGADAKARLASLISEGGSFPLSPRWLFSGLVTFDGVTVTILGLALLIATPVVRVAAAVVSFAIVKDRAFTAISAAVLAFVVASFFLGSVG
jgi:uncharacterized membrane protein